MSSSSANSLTEKSGPPSPTMKTSDPSLREQTHPGIAVINNGDADVAAQLVAGRTDEVLDEVAAHKLRVKIDLHLMPLMCLMYFMAFADKISLGQSAVLGLFQGTHLSQNQFNWLGTVFYLSYLVFEYPQNLALQKFPVGKWMSINIFVWGVALCCHAACTSFGGLFACRFILGMCEGAITPAFMIVTSMFYTRAEQTRRTGYWFLMNGFAIIFLGLVAFGLLHSSNRDFMPWQGLMIITGGITVLVSVIFWFAFPDSPATAWFLTHEERVMAVQRIRVNQTGIENKRWKLDQFMETLKDPKTWLLALFAAISNIVNSLTNQRQIIVRQFGYSPKNTTLLGTVDGAVEILVIWACVALASQKRIGRAYSIVICYIPAIIGAILVNTLSSKNKVGLLLSYYVSIFFIAPFVVFLAWTTSITAGHTKRITTNAIVMIAYAIGNAAGPFMWKAQYQPRNHVPWGIMSGSSAASAIIALILRWYLVRENKRREAQEVSDSYHDVHLATEKGGKVDTAFLDLTDMQNRDFRYVL